MSIIHNLQMFFQWISLLLVGGCIIYYGDAIYRGQLTVTMPINQAYHFVSKYWCLKLLPTTMTLWLIFYFIELF